MSAHDRDGNGYRHRYGNGNGYCHRYGNGHLNSNGDRDSHPDRDGDPRPTSRSLLPSHDT